MTEEIRQTVNRAKRSRLITGQERTAIVNFKDDKNLSDCQFLVTGMTLNDLAELSPTEYDREREDAAALLGIRKSTLDEAVEKKRRELSGQSIFDYAEPSEDAIALTFAEKYKNELRYCHTTGKWFVWDGARWKQEETCLAFHWARNLCREFNQTHRDKNLPKMRTAGAVEKFAQADRRFAVTHDNWDKNPWLLTTPDFSIDLNTGSKQENNPDNNITCCTTTTPSNIQTPVWDAFLEQVTQSDKYLLRYLKQVAGYCLTGITREHALFFIYGLGANGKSTLINTLSNVMGDYAISAAMDTFTASKYDRHPTELARLKGARLVTASETEEGRAWAESRIKQLTGGDPISARYMRKDFFEYLPEFKLVFLGNHKPVLSNVDEAQRRRFNIVPFKFTPIRRDTELPEKLKAEYPGILQWAINGCLDWKKFGLVTPLVVKEETDSYFSEQDTFSQWLDECTEKKSENTGETNARLFDSWTSWMKHQGEHAGSQKGFSEKLIRAGFRKVKKVPGFHDKRGFVGISLVVSEESYVPYAD